MHTENKHRVTDDGNTALHYAGACRFLNGFLALVYEGFAYDILNASRHTAMDKLLNAWPDVKTAFEYMAGPHIGIGPFTAMTMGFFQASLEQAQELADQVTEQPEAEWPDTALLVRDLLAVYNLWAGPGGAQP